MKGYYEGQTDAYSGFGRSDDSYEYKRGYGDMWEQLEREEYAKEIEKQHEREYYYALFEYEHYLETKIRDCRP